MDPNAILEVLIKSALQEMVKRCMSISLLNKELFKDRFANEILKNYLQSKGNSVSVLKTLMHTTPVDFDTIYQPVELEYYPNKLPKKYEETKDLFDKSNYITIIGPAGSGKTTLTKHIFLQCIKEKYKTPIIITFRSLERRSGEQKKITLKESIIKTISASESDVDFIDKCLKRGEFLIIFDGFDEKSDNQFEGHQEDIFDCLFEYPKNNYIITSRPYSGAELLPQFHNLQIKPLTRQGQLQFIQKQLSANNSNEKEIAAIINSIDTQSPKVISDLLKNPLLLLLYIITFKYTNTIPRHTYEFYQRVFDTLFLIHDAISKRNYKRKLRSSQLSNKEFAEIIFKYSYISYMESVKEFDVRYFHERIKKIQHTLTEQDIDNFLYDLLVNVPVLSEDNDKYYFSHISIQEYCCSRFISELPNDSSKQNAYKVVSKNISKRLSYQIDNFSKLCSEMDPVNYNKYFYMPSLTMIRNDIFKKMNNINIDKIGHNQENEQDIAYQFLLNLISKLNISEKSESSYILINPNYSSLHYFLNRDFHSYSSIIDKIYRYLRSKFVVTRYFTQRVCCDDIDFAANLIVKNSPDIVRSINNLLQEISVKVYVINKDIEDSIKSNDDIIGLPLSS
ncbi:NACHT domain-containing protein [Desulfobulbus sp. F5]|nr:NACHT domain-containing protein [Desulfobulbus sp. F5]